MWSEKAEVDSKRFAIQAGTSQELVKASRQSRSSQGTEHRAMAEDTSFTLTATIRRDGAGGPQPPGSIMSHAPAFLHRELARTLFSSSHDRVFTKSDGLAIATWIGCRCR